MSDLRININFLERREETHVLERPEGWEDMSEREQKQYVADHTDENTLSRVDYSGVDDEEYRMTVEP